MSEKGTQNVAKRARGRGTSRRNRSVKRSLAATIEAANTALLVDGQLDRIGEFFATDYVVHLTDRDMTGGHAAIRKTLGLYRRAFRDMRVEVEILARSADRIAWQRTLRATNMATFRGFPATGRPIVWREMVTSRFRAGRIAEDWLVSDLAEHSCSRGRAEHLPVGEGRCWT